METRARPTSRGRARCVSVRMGRRWEQTAAGPRAGACRLRRVWATLPCPSGQGALPVCVFDAVCPAGKGASELARRIMACRGKKAGFRNVLPIRGLSRRAGGRGNGLLPARGGVFPARRNPYALPMSLSPQETEIRPISPSKHALPPAKPFTFIHPWQTRPITSRVSSPPHFAANIQRAQVQRSTPAKGHLSALPVTASSPKPSRRENGGLCPHPLKGPDP